MRIYFGELIKAFCCKSTAFIFIGLTILNGCFVFFVNNSSSTLYSPKSYRAVYEDIEGLSPSEAKEKLSDEKKKTRLFYLLYFGIDINEELVNSPEIDGEKLLSEFSDGNFLKYETNILREAEVLSVVYSEISSCADFDKYLENIDKSAMQMSAISVFSDPSSFTYKNIIKAPKDLAHLKGSVLEIAPSKGITMAVDSPMTDVIAFLMIICVVVKIVTQEKEQSQLMLSKSTYRGRATHSLSKLFACITCAVICVILLYSVNFVVSYFTYGFGNLSRQIHSISQFKSSIFRISVLEFLALFLSSKLLVYCIFAAFCYLCAVCSKTAVGLYITLAAVITIEILLFTLIPSTSYLSVFKYVNIVSFAQTADTLGVYKNINVFGTPINYVSIFYIVSFFLLAVLSVLSIVIYSKQRVQSSKSRLLRIFSLISLKGRHVCVFAHECYKLFISGRVLIFLLAFVCIQVLCYKPVNEEFFTLADSNYKKYMLYLEGSQSEEKDSYIQSEEQRISSLINKVNILLSENDINPFVLAKMQTLSYELEAIQRVAAHSQYLKSTNGGEFLYDEGYKLLLGGEKSGNKDLFLALIALAMTICCLSYVYSVEYETGVKALQRSSAKGRGTTFAAKFLVGLIASVLVFLITYTPYFYSVFKEFGTNAINAPLCSIEGFNLSLSIRSYLILISLIRLLALTLAMLLIYALSIKLKSLVSTILAATSLLILPIIFVLLGMGIFRYFLITPVIIVNL